jgi:hypothetical protein
MELHYLINCIIARTWFYNSYCKLELMQSAPTGTTDNKILNITIHDADGVVAPSEYYLNGGN